MTWLYHQVRCLPPEILSHIACEQTTNLNQFALPNIHCSKSNHSVRWLWDYTLNALGLRPYFHNQILVARQQEVHILHSHFGDRGWADIEVAQSVGLKHIVTFYGFDVNRIPLLHPKWKTRYARLFDHVDRVLCEGVHMADCIRKLGCPSEKIKVHHLGIDLEAIPFKPRIWSRGEPLRFLIAATFREKKGIPYALEALGRMQKDFPMEITVIGDATQEDRSQMEKGKILKIMDRYQLHPKIKMMGFQSMNVLFKEAYEHHIFLSPSVTAEDGDTEGGAPVSILEMLASGMPVVSSRHCDIPSIVHHNKSGFLAEERNVEELAQHIQWLTHNPSDWKSLVENGRRHLEREYDAKTQGIRLAQIYQEIHNQTPVQ
jgi:colanic acid/amylovoran biosynthesis glycosyltransferase